MPRRDLTSLPVRHRTSATDRARDSRNGFAMSKTPWLKFYPSDWRSDPLLRTCSLAARGLWIEMLSVMHAADPVGSLSINGIPLAVPQIAMLTGCTPKEAHRLIAELDQAGVFSREADGTIFSRRMRRDVLKAERERTSGKVGGNPMIRRGSVPKEERVRPFKRSDSPVKTQRIFAKTGGRCNWCSVDLIFNGTDTHPQNFHVDHVVPVCDGGTNDEDNLVPSCAACNHDRARIDYPTPTLARHSDTNPDTKAQIPEARYQKDPSREHKASGGGGRSSPRIRQVHPAPAPNPTAWDDDAPFGRDASGGAR